MISYLKDRSNWLKLKAAASAAVPGSAEAYSAVDAACAALDVLASWEEDRTDDEATQPEYRSPFDSPFDKE